jgi:hypothetical protein
MQALHVAVACSDGMFFERGEDAIIEGEPQRGTH